MSLTKTVADICKECGIDLDAIGDEGGQCGGKVERAIEMALKENQSELVLAVGYLKDLRDGSFDDLEWPRVDELIEDHGDSVE